MRITPSFQQPRSRQHDRRRPQAARQKLKAQENGDLTLLSGLIQASLRRRFCSFEIAFLGHPRPCGSSTAAPVV
jgi:hypothetical protein